MQHRGRVERWNTAPDASLDGDATTRSDGQTTDGDGGYPTWSCLAPYTTPTTRDAATWPWSSDSPWNTPIGAGATFEAGDGPCTTDFAHDPNAPYINAHEWSQPTYLAVASDPPSNLYQGGMLEASNVHVPANAAPALPIGMGTDGNLNVIDPARTWVDELWQASRVSSGWTSSSYSRNLLDALGCTMGGIRAYGGSAISGLVRTGELASEIRHAVGFANDQSQQTNSWVWPAISNDGAPSRNYTGHMPMGQLVAIPPNLDLCALGLSAGGLVLARAIQDFGAYLVDSGGGVSFYADPRVEDDPTDGEASLLAGARGDLATIMGAMRCVTNNGSSNVGGGGARRAPPAPALP